MNKMIKILGRQVRVITYNSYSNDKGYCYKVLTEPKGYYLGCVENIDENETDEAYIREKIRGLVTEAIKEGEFDD